MAMQVEASNRIQAQSGLNSYVQTGTKGDKAKNLADNPARNWQKGDLIEGKILSADGKSIRLEVDGQVIEAKLEGKFDFWAGENVRLSVVDTGLGKLLLKPMVESLAMTEKGWQDLLSQLGLRNSPQTKAIVEELMAAKLPLSADNLKALQELTVSYPQLNLRTMVFLLKNKIPLNSENINELLKCQNPPDMLANRLNSMINRLVGMMQSPSGETILKQLAQGNPETEKILNYLKMMVKGQEGEEGQASSRLLNDFLNSGEKEGLAQEIENLGRNWQAGGQDWGPQAGELPAPYMGQDRLGRDQAKLAQDLLSQVKQGILRGELESLQAILDKTQDLPTGLQQVLRQLLAERLTSGALRKGIFLKAEGEDPVKHLEALFTRLAQAKTNDDKASFLVKHTLEDIASAKDSLGFMAKFQDNAGFLQLPFLMGDKVLNGELFVLNHKKAQTEAREEVSALLQLDFATLGHLDTFIKKNGPRLQIDFYAEDEEKEQWIRARVFLLHNQLVERKYQVMAINTFVKKEKTDGFADFLANDRVKKLSRFSFDMRA